MAAKSSDHFVVSAVIVPDPVEAQVYGELAARLNHVGPFQGAEDEKHSYRFSSKAELLG